MKNIVYTFLLIYIFIPSSNAQEYYWVQRNGPLGGIIHSIVFNSNGDIFVSTGNPGSNGGGSGRDGIYRSTNAGQNWEQLSIPFSYGKVINCLAINENDIIYAGSYYGGVYMSTDNGENWETANGELLGGKVIDALTCIGDNIIIAGARGDGKIYRSTDAGSTWNSVIDQQASSTALRVGPDGKVYFGSLSYVYCSVNNGQTWQKIEAFDFIGANDFAFVGNNTIFVASWFSGIFKSTNNGQTWLPCNNGLPSLVQIMEVVVVSESHIFLATRENGIYRSDDFGQNWIPANAGLSRSEILSVNSIGNELTYAGTDGGFFVSNDLGENWTESNTGLINSIVRTIILSPDQNIMYAGTSGGVIKSSDFGITWIRVNNGLVQYDDIISLAVKNNGTLFAGTKESGIYTSEDGENWSNINNDLLKKATIKTIFFDTTGNVYLGVGKNSNSNNVGMLRSTDNGEHWSQINNGLTDLVINTAVINSGNVIFVGTDTAGIFYSTNSGNEWHKIQNTSVSNFRIYLLKIDEDDQIYAGLFDGEVKLYYSSDNGNSWNFIDRYANFSLYAMEIVDGKYGYIGGYNGIQRYSIENNIWTFIFEDINPLLNNRSVFAILMSDYGYIYAGTDAAGVFRSRDPVLNTIENSLNYPINFFVYQNYPNPFNPTTKIKYQLPKAGFVTLKVYDVLGNEIATMVREEKPAGSYEVEFDANNLSSGIYFYELQAGEFVEIKKMIYLK